jgi:hypothetical protein
VSTTTPYLALYQPANADGDDNGQNWTDEVNGNFDVLDASIEDIEARSISWPVIDVHEVYGPIVIGTATGDDYIANAAAINAAIDDNMGGSGAKLQLPAGTINIAGTHVGANLTSDESANIDLAGFGHRGTTITQTSASTPVMQWETTGGNLRGLQVHDMQLRGDGDDGYNLELLKVGYSFFWNLTLWTGNGLHVDTSSFQNVIRDCWWLNTSAVGRAVTMDSGELTLINPLIGEDAGSIWVQASELRVIGGQMRQMSDGVDADGPNAMGESSFVVTGDGRLAVHNTLISFGDRTDVLCSIDNGIARFEGCHINVADPEIAATKYLIRVRTLTGAQHFEFTNNVVEAHDAVNACDLQIYDKFASTDAHDSKITGNTFLSGTNWSMTIDDDFFKPEGHNVYANNTAKETTGVT